MKTKNIFKTLAFAMLMPAMLLTTACSSDNDVITNNENINKKGYEIPVTLNATRQGDDATTRATYDESTKKLNFSTGDQLYVRGNHTTAGDFTGTLEWKGGTKFSGTITTTNQYSGTAIDLLTSTSTTFVTAILLPKDYTTYNFLYFDIPLGMNINVVIPDYKKAFATSKATAVEQFSYEYASTYSNGFTLTPRSAILNFTITGLTANKKVEVNFQDYKYNNIPGEVTTDGSGTATFAIGIFLSNVDNLNGCSLNVDGNDITLVSNSTPLVAGKIYNITRSATPDPDPTPAAGQFSVSATKKVTFSSGNLQATYNGTDWTWAFAENQWDYIGNAAGNTSINGNGTVSASNVTVDLFGWVGASSTWTGAAQYGITSSSATNNTNGYGNNASEALKSDWGNTIGSGWRTLTSDEWQWMLGPYSVTPNPGTNCRTSSTIGGVANARWVKAVVHSTKGLIIYPDALTWNDATMGTAPTTSNTANNDFTYSTLTNAQWSALEAAGCVFLPAAGFRSQASVNFAGSRGGYWSSSSDDASYAYRVFFKSDNLNPAFGSNRYGGNSVRLVREVAAPAPAPEEEFVTFSDGVKVATMNLGATTVAESAETCYGDYYAWGATEPFGTVTYTAYNAGTVTATTGHDGGYSQANAPYYSGSAYTKYTSSLDATLEAADDAVAANMPGWHMPTQAEMQTLFNACGGSNSPTGTISSDQDYPTTSGIYWVTGGVAAVKIGDDTYKVNGVLFVKDATHHVFFPAAGRVYGTKLITAGMYGSYWSSSLYLYTDDTNNAYNLNIFSSAIGPDDRNNRLFGFSVRPFKD